MKTANVTDLRPTLIINVESESVHSQIFNLYLTYIMYVY